MIQLMKWGNIDEVNILNRIVGEYLVNMFVLFVEVNKVNSSVTKEDFLFLVEAGGAIYSFADFIGRWRIVAQAFGPGKRF